ncbi:hypothetical protein LX64_02409 [Chitinophaga skermanii]|uniref:TraB family protein n=1 Tax=Chitinophaga skermanii TaxID=331697 RepID=A0A327QNI0_9BACT|nr:TraB/GumN family protein [Chitinophaga skermanii]RAJ05254.1 hypothetical protein LX64_02409 [Chitinophaga skermanii]
MKKTGFLFFVLCWLGISAHAQSLCWKITGNGLQQPSYLFGTIHIICPGDYKLNPSASKAFSETKSLYLEVDLNDPLLTQKMQPYMLFQGDTTIRSFLSDTEFNKVSSYMTQNFHLDEQVLLRLKPFTLVSLLYPTIAACTTPMMYDMEFNKMALTQKKPIKGLESIEYQFSALLSVSDSIQCNYIVETINDLPKQQAMFNKLLSAYKKADLDALYNIAIETPEMKGYEDILVYQRNRNWIPVIKTAAAKKSTFFAMGALHLAGNDGVIALLKKEGYTVTPVM